MDVIPAIDLLEGRCVRLYQGDYAQAEVFSDDPLEMAQRWVAEGAPRLHLVDLDGAKVGVPVNTDVIRAIAQSVAVPVQVGGGLRSRDSVSQLLDVGVERVILGTVAVEQPQLVEELCQVFPGRIAVGIDARNGLVATRGWLEDSTLQATDLARQLENCGVSAIIYTDIQRDGTLQGPNLKALRQMSDSTTVPLIASGGISSLTDLLALLALEPDNLTGAIVGKALYTGAVQLREAVQAVGAGRLQDVPLDLDSQFG